MIKVKGWPTGFHRKETEKGRGKEEMTPGRGPGREKKGEEGGEEKEETRDPEGVG